MCYIDLFNITHILSTYFASYTSRRTLSEIYRPVSAPRIKTESAGGSNPALSWSLDNHRRSNCSLAQSLSERRSDISSVFGVRVKIFGLASSPVVWDFFSFDTVRMVQKTIRDQLKIHRCLQKSSVASMLLHHCCTQLHAHGHGASNPSHMLAQGC